MQLPPTSLFTEGPPPTPRVYDNPPHVVTSRRESRLRMLATWFSRGRGLRQTDSAEALPLAER
jgi:hypothetical protein